MPDITFLLSFLLYIPLLLIISIFLSRKNKISVREIGIELIIALIITLSTAYIVKGEYNFYVGGPSGIGHGYPYYHSFIDLQTFQITLPGTEKDLTSLSNPNNYSNISDFSVIMTSVINFWFNMIFWFFVISVVYFIIRKKILPKGKK